MTSPAHNDRREAGRDEGSEERVVPMRVQKFLARAGVASRRGSEDLMTAGRVRVNGQVVTSLGSKVDPAIDAVEVDGVRVELASGPVYLALNKPAGTVTTMSDPHGRPTVADLMPTQRYPGLFPVGRLDADTTGLLLFTTDGDLSHRLLHPRHKVPKTYRALVDGHPTEPQLNTLRRGVQLDDGLTAPATVRLVARKGPGALVEITITEGRKRQVRRMFSAISHPVRALHRISVGPVVLGNLEEGSWRHLTGSEVDALKFAAGVDKGGST